MNNNLNIELYVDDKGYCQVLNILPLNDRVRFVKKLEDFKKFTLLEFLKSKDIDRIKGSKDLYEVKFRFSKPPYRIIASLINNTFILLLIFKGSGSKGRLDLFLPKAINQLSNWKLKNNIK